MEIRLYKPPSLEEPYFTPLGVTYRAPKIMYRESFYSVGDFTINIPRKTYGADKFAKYLFVLINKVFWGMILEIGKSLEDGGDNIEIWGISLDGLTLGRVTVPPGFTYEEVGGVAGYDVVNGTTETCMKHYAAKNWLDPLSETRHIPNFVIAPDMGRGIPDDKYMSRFEQLNKPLEDLGQYAKLGYAIKPDLQNNITAFDCVQGTDRTAEQSEYPRIVFSPERGNIKNLRWLDSDRNMKNLFYASLSGSEYVDQTYTATVTRTPELPSGLFRWEQHMDISAKHPEPGHELEELDRLALARAESYKTVETFTGTVLNKQVTESMSPAKPKVYGRDYFLGDMVTIQNKDWKLTMNAQLIEMQTEGDKESITQNATFNNGPINVFDRIRRQIRGG